MEDKNFNSSVGKSLTGQQVDHYDTGQELATEPALRAVGYELVRLVPRWKQMNTSTVIFEIHGKQGEIKGVHLTVRTKYGS